jgi:hypothetical protein
MPANRSAKIASEPGSRRQCDVERVIAHSFTPVFCQVEQTTGRVFGRKYPNQSAPALSNRAYTGDVNRFAISK